MGISVRTGASSTGFRKIGSRLAIGSRWRRHVATLAIALLVASVGLLATPSLVRAQDACVGSSQSLTAPSQVYPGAIFCSNEGGNQAYSLQFQGDCNLVLLTGRWQPLWSSVTGGRTCTSTNSCLAMQNDGNLVIYYPNGCGNPPAIWSSGTDGHAAANYCVVVQVDGNVVIYAPGSPCGSGGSYLTGANSPTLTQSSNTRPFEGADSWRTSPVVEGRNTCPYPCKSTLVNFRAIDQYSARRPNWTSAVQAAVTAWNQSPTAYSFAPITNDTWNYIDATFPGDTTYANCGTKLNLYPTVTGLTLDYDQSGTLFFDAEAHTIKWTDVCLNEYQLPSSGGSVVQNTVGHELGHTIGLAHNLRDPNSIMNPNVSNVLAPDSNDTGAPSPACPNQGNGYGGLGGGSTCIYGWGD